MTKQEVYAEIEGMFGFVPSFLKLIPDDTLEHEWHLMKKIELDEGPVPNKYRELIGLGIAAVTKCRYCILYHTTAAKLYGATDEEINHALLFAKQTTGWSNYINGMQLDYDQFKAEMDQMVEYFRAHELNKANGDSFTATGEALEQ